MNDLPSVALLGTGTMGLPMGRNLIATGLPLRVWNRTTSRTAPLVQDGAIAAAEPEEAVSGSRIVVTMLADGPTVHAVAERALPSFPAGAIWLQMSTVGPDDTERLMALADNAGVAFVDAPVLGTKKPAEQGQLVVLASGTDDLLRRCAPVFDAVGSRTLVTGDVGMGTRLKLVANTWVIGVTNAAAECVALAGQLGVDPGQLLDAVEGSALDLPYLRTKGQAMIEDDYAASFPLKLAAKDARLCLHAAGAADLGATRAALAHLERAESDGYGDQDMAALYRGVLPRSPS